MNFQKMSEAERRISTFDDSKLDIVWTVSPQTTQLITGFLVESHILGEEESLNN